MPDSKPAYQVFATKYRPVDLDGLIGQDMLVRTISNAIKNNRIANAFLLTGIRGVGKTTTARIIARALNCTGQDGKGGPTAKPCGVCSNCKSILEDRHPDVLEMDAASRTGVDDVREVIDNTHYMPVSARYKIYIIDEVHMLSKNAFNALLKTLEEPPSHVKFIFATTEIRKIPITILSRCQKFDLKRIGVEQMAAHLAGIAEKEGVEAEEAALKLVAANCEGSARDALSLFDQVVAHSEGNAITAQTVRQVLGLADKSRIASLFSVLAEGNIAESFDIFRGMYNNGGDPLLVLNDLLEFSHLVSKLKVAPDSQPDATIAESEYNKAKELAEKLELSFLTRCWQMLLKGISEVKIAPDALAASEMILIRLAYMADLPSPASLIKQMNDNGAAAQARPASRSLPPSGGYAVPSASVAPSRALQPQEETEETTALFISSFEQMAEIFREKGELLIYNHLISDIRPVKFEHGRVEFTQEPWVGADFAGKVRGFLEEWTGGRWVVSISVKTEGLTTLKENKEAAREAEKQEMKNHPKVRKVLEFFPGATISGIAEN